SSTKCPVSTASSTTSHRSRPRPSSGNDVSISLPSCGGGSGWGVNVLIVGGGAREHALTWKALQSPLTGAVYCAPGNAATAAIAVNTGIEATDVDGIARFVSERDVSLTVIGPESAVAAGLADRLTATDRLVFGPTAAAGRIESSKAFGKSLMARAGVATPGYQG